MIHVLLEGSSPDLQAEIAALIRDHPGFRLVESSADAASDGEDQPRPDVVILGMDESEPAGEPFGADRAAVPIIVVADDLALMLASRGASRGARRTADHWLTEGLPARVRAILPRNVSATEMIAAIEAVAAGLYVFHPADADLLPGFHLGETDPAPEVAAPLAESLTPREIEVLQLLAGGLGNKEIASQLKISEHTAKFHVASIMGKLGAASRTEAVTRGIRHGLVMI